MSALSKHPVPLPPPSAPLPNRFSGSVEADWDSRCATKENLEDGGEGGHSGAGVYGNRQSKAVRAASLFARSLASLHAYSPCLHLRL
jgi:hypothetical protein